MFRLANIRRNIPLNYRIVFLLSLIFILLIIPSVIIFNNIYNRSILINNIAVKQIEEFSEFNSLIQKIYSISNDTHNYILSTNEEFRFQEQLNIELNVKETDLIISKLGERLTERKEYIILNSLQSEYKKFININNEILILSKNNNSKLAIDFNLTYGVSALQNLEKEIKTIEQEIIKKKTGYYNEAYDQTIKALNTYYAIIGIIIVISILLFYVFVKDFKNSVNLLSNSLKSLLRGELPEKKAQIYNDEIGQMFITSNQIIEKLSKLGNFTKELADGNYQANLNNAGRDDILLNRFINLKDNLQKSQEEEKKRRIEDERRNWSAKGLAKFSEILRHSAGNLSEFADNIIKNCIRYLDANLGGIYIYNDDNKDEIFLELIASYAYNRKKFLSKKIKLGDGLVGTCAIEKETIFLSQLPKDYLSITSGFGGAEPKCLLLAPLKIEENILGVIELASFKIFEKFEIEFVERLGESIAISLSTAKINARTVELFEESQRQALELASKEEEMRQNLEEMRATQENAIRNEIEMRGIMNAVENSLIKCEYDVEGNLITANNHYLTLMDFSLDEIKGKNVRMFVPDDKMEKFNQYWVNLMIGVPYQGVIQRKTKTNEMRWLLMSYTPIRDNDGIIFKVLFLANDITEYQVKSSEIKVQSELLQKQREELNNITEEEKKKSEIKLKEASELKKTYENELLQMSEAWMESLENVESFKELLNNKIEILKEKEFELNQSNAKIIELQEKIEKTFGSKQKVDYISELEVEKLYAKWIKGISKDK